MLKKLSGFSKKILNYESVSYIIFGVLTTLIDWLVYTGLGLINADYVLKTVLSWTAAVLFAYITNKLFVFRKNNFDFIIIVKEMALFFFSRIVSLGVNVLGMYCMFDLMGINEYISKAFLSVLVVILNYIFSKIFVFTSESKNKGKVV